MSAGRISSEAAERRSSHLPSELAAAVLPRALRRRDRTMVRAGRAARGAVVQPLRADEGDRAEGASPQDPAKFPGWARGPAPSVSLFPLPQMWTRWLALALVAVAWVHAEVGERPRRSELGLRGHLGVRAGRAGSASWGCSPGVGLGVSMRGARGRSEQKCYLRNLNLQIRKSSLGHKREPHRG